MFVLCHINFHLASFILCRGSALINLWQFRPLFQCCCFWTINFFFLDNTAYIQTVGRTETKFYWFQLLEWQQLLSESVETGIIHLVSMQNFPKNYHFLPPDMHTCVRNDGFLENFAYILNEWSQKRKFILAKINKKCYTFNNCG